MIQKQDQNEDKDKKETPQTVGFQRIVRVKGSSDTDKLFNERMETHKKEVEEFYKLYPDLKEKAFED